ncbi:hypothetical protein NQK81_12870 [Amycolatopsis roodepoortensis]|uniref:hypothetical protein n=1 Tax=Amycolatopsis roodepoortensis TaxID=700274 RepID=UPI00214BE88F|nr:hypothetical protein [Amycolatopsis roodepoortensis]UUV34297.1 hypothetical protein NQK81_12870 [Amycolatopsis roodepoortensis]
MRIRVEGTETEIAAAVERIATVLEIQEASRFYANRGATTLGRVYLTVATPPATPAVRADAERTDQQRQLPGTSRKDLR